MSRTFSEIRWMRFTGFAPLSKRFPSRLKVPGQIEKQRVFTGTEFETEYIVPFRSQSNDDDRFIDL